MTPPPPKPNASSWAELPDEELLKLRIADLKLRIEGSPVEPLIEKFYHELEEKGITFRPACYLTTEWLAPDKVPLLGIPFCLAHPRLKKLEQTMMLEVEGGTEKECLKLLRHEAGHAFNYAYRFYKRTRWRDLFGPFSMEYNVDDYYPRPYSKQFVVHLEGHYAQAHPDEDFAETFAVWLTPGLDWRKKYRGWGALKKLEYVDHLMTKAGPRTPPITTGPKLWPVSRVRSTLERYYKRKRAQFAEAYTGYFDPDLHQLFSAEPNGQKLTASRFLHSNRRMLIQMVARWSHVPKYSVDQLIRRLSRRSQELNLFVIGSEQEALFPTGVYLTALACERRERESGVLNDE